MRSLFCVLLAVMILFAPTTALGYGKHRHKRHVLKIHVQRQVQTVYVEPVVRKKHAHRVVVVVVKPAKDQAMVAASRDARTAHALLKSALSVYDGHREAAIALCSLAVKDIKAGIKVPPSAPLLDFSYQAPLKVHKGRKSGQIVYSQAQIDASDVQLQSAIQLIRSAIDDLYQAAGDHGGYRTQAANLLNEALQEAQACLRTRR
jgi:predicted RNA-binding Zn ribbon-like protein